MGKCKMCGTVILFGGQTSEQGRFCSPNCLEQGEILAVGTEVPADIVRSEVATVHSGDCPVCARPGPVDVHTSYRVLSLLVMTSWSSRPRMSCRSCGAKAKLADTAYSLLLGWWGFPWGVLFTPIQVGRNLFGLASAPDPSAPSEHLEQFVRMDLAARMVDARAQPAPLAEAA